MAGQKAGGGKTFGGSAVSVVAGMLPADFFPTGLPHAKGGNKNMWHYGVAYVWNGKETAAVVTTKGEIRYLC